MLRNKITLKNYKRNQSGQALLIILLVIAVSLTVVLSSVSRSISDISITEVEEDSSRAFSAAEAGVEEALLDPPSPGTHTYIIPGGLEAEVNTEASEPEPGDYRYTEKLDSGEELIIWFVEHDIHSGELNCDNSKCLDSNKFKTICWGDIGGSYSSAHTPAVQMTLYYDYRPTGPLWLSSDPRNFSNVKTETVGYDPVALTRTNGFLEADTPGPGCKIGKAYYKYEVNNINFTDFDFNDDCKDQEGCLIMAKLRMIYNVRPEEIGFQLQANKFPPQGEDIGSTGTSGEVQRKVEVFKGYAEPLEIFTGAVFSNKGLDKD